MSMNDIVKHITQQVVTYIDTPVHEKQKRKISRQKNRDGRMSNRWFGVFPLAIKILWQNKKKR